MAYLGRVVGQGHVCPVDAKVRAVEQYPFSTKKKELMHFSGLAGLTGVFVKTFPQ